MAAWDNVGLPGSPQAPGYAAPLLDFSPLGDLAKSYYEGQGEQFKATQRKRELELQKPVTSNDPTAVISELMRRGGAPYAERLIPFLQQQQAGQPSALFGGGGGQPAPQDAGAVPAAPAAGPGAVAPIPAAATPQPRPTGGYTGGDSGHGTVASIVAGVLPENSPVTGQVISNIAKAVGADPNVPLTPEQQARASAIVSSYAQRTGLAQSGAAPAAAAPAEPATPATTPSTQSQSQVILPPGFDDPKKAIVALRREAVRVGANPYGKEQASELSGWANRIEAAVAGPQEFAVVGNDENGLPVHGFVNKYTQTVKPATGVTAAAGGPTASLTGHPYLDTLDPGRASQIKAIVEGRMNPPGGMALKSPQIQALMRAAAQYEPGFDLTKWAQRSATAKDFGSGKSAQNITAFNTAIGHLDTLDKAAEALGNSWSPHYNTVANWVLNAKGDPRVKQFEVARTAVADELTRAFRGSGGNVHDLIQWEKAINSAGSPEQLKSAVKQAVELLRSRIEAVGDQYNRGMGASRAAPELLSPKAQTALARLSGEAAPAKTPDASAPAAPTKTISTKAEYDTLPKGASFIGPDGKPWQKP